MAPGRPQRALTAPQARALGTVHTRLPKELLALIEKHKAPDLLFMNRKQRRAALAKRKKGKKRDHR